MAVLPSVNLKGLQSLYQLVAEVILVLDVVGWTL